MFVLCQVSIGHSPFGCRIIGKRPDPFLLFFFRDVQEEFESVKASDPKVKAYYDAINAKANEKKNETTTGTSNNKNETTASHTSNNATTKASVTTQAPTTKVNSATKPQTTASKNNKNKQKLVGQINGKRMLYSWCRR